MLRLWVMSFLMVGFWVVPVHAQVSPEQVDILADQLCQQALALRNQTNNADMTSASIAAERSINADLAAQYLALREAITAANAIPMKRLNRCYQDFFNARKAWDRAAENHLSSMSKQAVNSKHD